MQNVEYVFPILVLIYTSTLVIFSIKSNKEAKNNKRVQSEQHHDFD